MNVLYLVNDDIYGGFWLNKHSCDDPPAPGLHHQLLVRLLQEVHLPEPRLRLEVHLAVEGSRFSLFGDLSAKFQHCLPLLSQLHSVESNVFGEAQVFNDLKRHGRLRFHQKHWFVMRINANSHLYSQVCVDKQESEKFRRFSMFLSYTRFLLLRK